MTRIPLKENNVVEGNLPQECQSLCLCPLHHIYQGRFSGALAAVLLIFIIRLITRVKCVYYCIEKKKKKKTV